MMGIGPDMIAGEGGVMDDRMLTLQQVAEWMQVHEETVRRWLRNGDLAGINLGGKSGYRIRESEVEAFLKRREEASKSLAESNPGEAGSPSPGRTGEAAVIVSPVAA
jgi:excisionase family DNA binding protein